MALWYAISPYGFLGALQGIGYPVSMNQAAGNMMLVVAVSEEIFARGFETVFKILEKVGHRGYSSDLKTLFQLF